MMHDFEQHCIRNDYHRMSLAFLLYKELFKYEVKKLIENIISPVTLLAYLKKLLFRGFFKKYRAPLFTLDIHFPDAWIFMIDGREQSRKPRKAKYSIKLRLWLYVFVKMSFSGLCEVGATMLTHKNCQSLLGPHSDSRRGV